MRHILQPVPEHLFQILIGSLPCLVVVEKATYSGVWVEQLLGFGEVGNGVEYHIILLIGAWLFGIIVHSDCKEREIIHKALEEIAHISLLSLLSDMGNILWGKTTFEIAITKFIATRNIRETDSEIWFAVMLKSQLLTLSFGEFDVYTSSS